MSEHLEITGAVSPPEVEPKITFRLEVYDFVKDTKRFSLYVQALRRCQQSNIELADSYFQIAGIHGLPHVRWDGAGPEVPVETEGYCQHNTTIFATWHRPYCALLEQTINRHAVEIASEYEVDREAWKKAAASLRLPYWDWALHPLPPKEFYDHGNYSQLTIALPDGTFGAIENPLLGYQFPNSSAPTSPTYTTTPFANLPRTIRHPRLFTPESMSDVESFEHILRDQFEKSRRYVSILLLKINSWRRFGFQEASHGTSNFSLEALHGTMHGCIGGGGHMSLIPYAAFDPLFWLHHCNVDRILALWQSIHPNQWVIPRADSDRTWVTNHGTLEVDGDTPLAPFWYSQSSYWTSNQCRDWTSLLYTYPDFDGLDMADAPAVSTAISQRARDLYLDRSTFAAFPGFTSAPAAPASAPAQGHIGVPGPSSLVRGAVSRADSTLATIGRDPYANGKSTKSKNLHNSSTMLLPEEVMSIAHSTSSTPSSRVLESIEWIVRIRCRQSDLYETSSVLIYIDGIPDEARLCLIDERFVGAYYPFVNPYPSGCKNCIKNRDVVVEGFVHITASLIQRGLDVMDVAVVEEYLEKNLKWATRKNTGEYGRVEDLKSLEVTLIDTPLLGPEGAEVPDIGSVRKHNEVTFDKPGGRVRIPGYA